MKPKPTKKKSKDTLRLSWLLKYQHVVQIFGRYPDSRVRLIGGPDKPLTRTIIDQAMKAWGDK